MLGAGHETYQRGWGSTGIQAWATGRDSSILGDRISKQLTEHLDQLGGLHDELHERFVQCCGVGVEERLVLIGVDSVSSPNQCEFDPGGFRSNRCEEPFYIVPPVVEPPLVGR